jgi:prepilin-type N-terminal cleavage/methylation domain-containing protein
MMNVNGPQLDRNRRGFTLVELLVCIGIIVILVSMLLPTLGRARSAANTAYCLANLRSIGQAMTMYVSENNGWIPGSGNTTGRHIWKESKSGTHDTAILQPSYSITNIPRVNEPLDWAGPLARVMQLGDPSLTGTDGTARFKFYVRATQFQCPAYAGVMAFPNTTSGFYTALGAQPAFSYNLAQTFLLRANANYNSTRNGDGLAGNMCLPQAPYWVLPNKYQPKIVNVGVTSAKVFAADGAKRSRNFSPGAFQITYGLSSDPQDLNTNETMYADYGPFQCNTRSYGRTSLAANTATPTAYDTRILSMRHGKMAPRSVGSMMRLNLVFYDGHAENMDDLAACNPNFWLPKGTTWDYSDMTTADSSGTGTKICYTDVFNKYMKNVTASNPFVAQ